MKSSNGMIITKTPLRLSLAGGGTDLPEYYTQYGSHVITSAVDKHIYLFVKHWFDPAIRIAYSKTEIVNMIDEIQHPMVREALRYLQLTSHVEIAAMADLPAGTGMGSSGAFAVGLLNSLHAFKGTRLGGQQLAEQAFHIQNNILSENGGKQDQYAAAFGGIISLKIGRDGNVDVHPLSVKPDFISEMEERLACFYTGIRRSAPEIQSKYCNSIKNKAPEIIESLHKIKKISELLETCLEKGDITRIGHLFEEHWEAKRLLSENVSNHEIDRWHDLAIEAGAVGGKVLGAGGGGYMAFLCKDGRKEQIKRVLGAEGLTYTPIKFYFEGSKIFDGI